MDPEGSDGPPCHNWRVPEEKLRAAGKGDAIESGPFALRGVAAGFTLRFWPRGRNRAKPSHCSLFLYSDRDVELQADFYVNDHNQVMDRTGPVAIGAGTGRGWDDFGGEVRAEVTIAVVLLSQGGDATPAWPLPSHYRLGELLGAGAYGSVREAWDAKEQRKVAVKQVLQVFGGTGEGKRILREVAILSKLQHPNVVRIFDVTSAAKLNHMYITMELCDTDLKKVCRAPRGVSLPETKRLAYTLCLGLNYMHASNVYHRDLKPANCLANRDCTVKICDFNLARTVPENRDDGAAAAPLPSPLRRDLTQRVCTPWYRSPEVVLAMGYTQAMDVWGAGCILAELLQALNTDGRVPQSRPLFPGRRSWPLSGHGEQEGDQLDRIFDVLGTPFEDPRFRELPLHHQSQLRAYGPRCGKGLRAVLPPEASGPGLDLAEGMLRFFPWQRLSMEAALRHTFFRGARRESKDETDSPPKQRLDLGFDDCRVGTTWEIRQEMQRQVERFHGAPPALCPAVAGDEHVSGSGLTCICCDGAGMVIGIGTCPLCDGAKVFS